jgi:hypothetical protein
MEFVTFKQVVEIKLTKKDLLAYYKSNGIVDFPKLKNGEPHMAMAFNKSQMALLKKNKKEEILEKYNKEIIQNKKKKVDSTDNCPVCYDPLTEMSVLKCGHTFCVSCTISHFRQGDSCPLCRVKICEKPVKRTMMPAQMSHEIVTQLLAREERERMNLNMENYIHHRLRDYKRNSIDSTLLTLELCNEINITMMDLAESINTWYE